VPSPSPATTAVPGIGGVGNNIGASQNGGTDASSSSASCLIASLECWLFVVVAVAAVAVLVAAGCVMYCRRRRDDDGLGKVTPDAEMDHADGDAADAGNGDAVVELGDLIEVRGDVVELDDLKSV
jgi:hypothetical protein